MKKQLTTTLLLAFFGCSVYLPINTANAQTTFQLAYGGSGDDISYSTQQTSDGGYIVTGITTSYGAGGDDVFLLKSDGNGDTLWTKAYGGIGNDQGQSVQQTVDGGYIVTATTYSFGAGGADFYLIKTGSNGALEWSKTYGGTGDEKSLSVQQTTDGGYIVAGFTNTFGAGGWDCYVVKTDSLGNMVWNSTYGGTGGDWLYSVQQTNDGGYILSGTTGFGAGLQDVYLIKISSSGALQWSKTYGGSGNEFGISVQQTTDNGYIIGGVTDGFGAGLTDAYVIKTDSIGNTMWVKTYGGTGSDYGGSVRQTADGGYIIGGATNSFGGGLDDVYLLKIDASGDTLWTKTIGGTGTEGIGYEGGEVKQTSDGGYIISCVIDSFGAGLKDVFLIKTDANGNAGGCNTFNTATIVGVPAHTVSSGGSVSPGGTVNTPATVVSNTATVVSNLCPALTTVCTGDTVLLTISAYRGNIQWQESADSVSWSNITGATSDTEQVIIDSTTWYRAEVIDGTCLPAYSDIRKFIAITCFICGTDSVQDIDGNWYNTVLIGTQCWTAENMRTTKYPDGSSITKGNVTHGSAGWGTDQAWYSCPPNTSNNGEDCAAAASLGMIYQWSATMDGATIEGAQGICPVSWHVPTDAEWCTLENLIETGTDASCNLSGFRGASTGSKMVNHVADQNWNASTLTGGAGFGSSGLDLAPSGTRSSTGNYQYRGSDTFVWSSTASGTDGWGRFIAQTNTGSGRGITSKGSGVIVRCVKD